MRRLVGGFAAVALFGAAPAYAGTIQVGLTLRSGGLTVQAPAVSVAGGTAVQVPMTVADGRGSGAGWTLRVSGGSITAVTARCAAGSTCTLPVLAGGGKSLHAEHDTGMGVMQLVVTVAPVASGGADAPLAFTVS